MKFIPLTDAVLPDDQLKAELKAGREIGKLCLGQTALFQKKFLKALYIPYEKIHRVFRRVECVDIKMCCGRGQLQLENIVLCDKKQELLQVDLPDTKAALAFIEALQEKIPEVKIGVKK